MQDSLKTLANQVTGSYVQEPEGLKQIARYTEKDKVKEWFIGPLNRLKGDDAFMCLIVLFPLLEVIIRYELKIPDAHAVSFAHKSPALKWFAAFMTIPEREARNVWNAFRNGLMHRAMVQGGIDYSLTGRSNENRPAEVVSNTTRLYVWDFRDKVVAKLNEHHRKLWQSGTAQLPSVYVEG